VRAVRVGGAKLSRRERVTDPAEPWEARYRSGDMPWEKGEPSPGLVDFLNARPDLPRGSVLVPGCGTGHDARVWARHGFRALGLDIAEAAVRLARGKTREEDGDARFERADFLRDAPSEQFDWVFEHTLFCAIQPGERDLYVSAVLRWLKPGGQFLAAHYMLRENQDGPPFGCSQEELMERFSPEFELIKGWVPRSYLNRTGLELMLWWKRRG
jgi:SAM-dependent methyltransferase